MIGQAGCWDGIMTHQRSLGMFGFANLAWHPDLVQAADDTSKLEKQQSTGECMVSPLLRTIFR